MIQHYVLVRERHRVLLYTPGKTYYCPVEEPVTVFLDRSQEDRPLWDVLQNVRMDRLVWQEAACALLTRLGFNGRYHRCAEGSDRTLVLTQLEDHQPRIVQEMRTPDEYDVLSHDHPRLHAMWQWANHRQ